MRISDVHSMLTSTYIDWRGFLANPRYARAKNEITWSGRSGVFLPHTVRSADMLSLVENKEYSFQTLDNGSVLQFYYEFDNKGEQVKSASLAYYGAPATYQENEPIDSEDNYELLSQPQSKQEDSFVNWLRIDFSPSTARGVLHHDCHLHIGGFPASRLMVRRLPTPKQFVEFIIAICHPEQYKRKRLDSMGDYLDVNRIRSINEPVFACDDRELYDHLIHIRTPGD
jgi:hypothetical protein